MLYMSYNKDPLSAREAARLLRLCIRLCDCFTMTEVPYGSASDMQKALKPYLIRDFQTSRWFERQKVSPPMHVFLYRTDPGAGEILESYTKHLFRTEFRIPEQNMEDLCFFSDNTLIFGTMSEEKFCCVYPPSEGFEKELLSVRGDWRSTPAAQKPLRLPNTLRKYTEKRT